MGWQSAVPRKAGKDGVTWAGVCQLGQEVSMGTELLSHILPFHERLGSLPCS